MADDRGAVYLCVSPQATHSEMNELYIREILTHAAGHFGQSRKDIIIKTIGNKNPPLGAISGLKAGALHSSP